jgi:hypothetical protein
MQRKLWLAVALAASLPLLVACDEGDARQEDAAASNDNPGETAGCFGRLKTYRYHGSYDVSLPGASSIAFSFRGSAVPPDRVQMEVRSEGLTAEAIVVGDEVWLRAGDSGWEQDTDGTLGPTPKPDDFCIYGAADLEEAGIKGKRDRINGVAAVRYEVSTSDLKKLIAPRTGAALADISAEVGAMQMTLWVTEKERWPLRLTIESDR